jgi:hypothetical protein
MGRPTKDLYAAFPATAAQSLDLIARTNKHVADMERYIAASLEALQHSEMLLARTEGDRDAKTYDFYAGPRRPTMAA